MTVFAKTKCTISKALDIVGRHKFSEQWTGKEIDADPGDDPDAYARLKAARDELRIGALYHSEVPTWIMLRGGKQEVFLPVAWGPGGNVWAGCLVDRRWREEFGLRPDELVSRSYYQLMWPDLRVRKVVLAGLRHEKKRPLDYRKLNQLRRPIVYVDRAALEAKVAENVLGGTQGRRRRPDPRKIDDTLHFEKMYELRTRATKSGKVLAVQAAALQIASSAEEDGTLERRGAFESAVDRLRQNYPEFEKTRNSKPQ